MNFALMAWFLLLDLAAEVVLGIHRRHEMIADKADQQQPGHDIHRDRVCFGLRIAAVDPVLAEIVDQNWPQHARG